MASLCRVDGCLRSAVAKGMCGSHYNRNKRHGSPDGLKKQHGHRVGVGSKERPTYCTWRAMKSRCNNPKDKMYHRYGGRGISICDRWNDSFADFLADMGERPQGFTIERIDCTKGYEPGNCTWIAKGLQNENKSDSRLVTVYGKTMSLPRWHKIVAFNTKYGTIKQRLNRGWSHKEAVFGRAATCQ